MPLAWPGSGSGGTLVELKRALPVKLSVAEVRSRSRTSSTPAFDAKNAVCSSRKFALTLVSVLDIMTMPIKTALMSINISNARISVIPCSDVLVFLPRKRIISILLPARHGCARGRHRAIVERDLSLQGSLDGLQRFWVQHGIVPDYQADLDSLDRRDRLGSPGGADVHGQH